MPEVMQYLHRGKVLAARVPALGWAAGLAIAVSLAVVFVMETSGPPYAVLYDGLNPADGGKVIAQLQKLGIPYQLQAAGNVIMVPAPALASARLQLGALQVPGGDAQSAWDRLENAPMTTSDLAQNTMAAQALETSLEQSITGMNGIQAAQVYLALPPDTPFLADQPKPTASVVITASDDAAQAQGEAIANLVAGAVPGLAAAQVAVETTSGLAVYPATHRAATSSQLATIASVENDAAARIALLLGPVVGAGNFRTGVSADVDFTQDHVHQITYGPNTLVSHSSNVQSSQTGNVSQPAIGIPGALSNQPPAATTAAVPAAPTQAAPTQATPPAAAPAPQVPQQTSKNLDQTYVTDESDSDIVRPDWMVKSIAISVVLNRSALGALPVAQIKAAIGAAFAYPQVSVNVLAAPFSTSASAVPGTLAQAAVPLSRALLEMMAALALLLGVARPVGRRLATLDLRSALLPPPPAAAPRPLPTALPQRDYSALQEQARENPAGVARLLQSWADDGE